MKIPMLPIRIVNFFGPLGPDCDFLGLWVRIVIFLGLWVRIRNTAESLTSAFLAAKCSSLNPSTSKRVSNRETESEAISLFALYSKNLQATHT